MVVGGKGRWRKEMNERGAGYSTKHKQLEEGKEVVWVAVEQSRKEGRGGGCVVPSRERGRGGE